MEVSFNVNITSYSKLRDFLRYLFVYGCYSREDFNDIRDFSLRKYDDELRRLRILLGDKYLKEITREGKKYVRLDFSYYNILDNYLVESYLIRNYTPLNLSIYFNAYILLWKEEALSLDEINEQIENKINIERDFRSTTRRALEDMSSKGIIEKLKRDNRVLYKKREDIFKALTDDELKEIYIAVCYFSQVGYPLSLGRYLKDSLRRYMYYMRGFHVDELENIFLFKYSNFQQTIDEEIVWELEHIIENQREVKICYYNDQNIQKIVIGFPFKIIWDNSYGKWYLHMITNENCLKVLEVQDIIEIQKLDGKTKNMKLEEKIKEFKEIESSDYKKVKILFEVEEFNKRNFLIDKVKRENLEGTLQVIDEHTFIYTVCVQDWHKLKPWIMSFGSRAQVIDSDDNRLYREIKDEWIEMGELYGVVCGTKE